MSIEETEMGDPVTRENKKYKIRVCCGTPCGKSVGVIEEYPEKGIKSTPNRWSYCLYYSRHQPRPDPAGNAIYALKARMPSFSPHPRSQNQYPPIELMREGLKKCYR